MITRMIFFFFILFILPPPSSSASTPCALRHVAHGAVCVCNASHCDEVPPLPQPLPPGAAALYMSSAAGKRFELSTIQTINTTTTPSSSSSSSAESDGASDDAVLELDPDTSFQQLLGFGGAFSDSVGLNLNVLSARTRKQLLKAYFGPDGIDYSLGRVPIASTDFSARVYSYNDVSDDLGMAHFALAPEDHKLKIPYLKMANWLSGGELKLFATPWSAPAWMKETGKMSGGGSLKGESGGPFYATWAAYLVRFFEQYLREAGVHFWGMTVLNEPVSAGWWPWYGWQAMYMSAAMQRDFVRDLLGPALRNNSATSHLKLMVNDDNRAFLPSAADTIFADAGAAQHIDGVAVHWYWNRLFSVERLTETHQRHPNKFILPSEACNGWGPSLTPGKGVRLGDWTRGEAYARDIIDTLEHWAAGWVDWNLCLDAGGGPSWARNWVDAPVIVNASTDEFYKQPMYYAIGHFSKFMRPGSVRIASSFTDMDADNADGKLAATAVLDSTRHQLVVVLQNRDAQRARRVSVRTRGIGATLISVPMETQSIATLVMPWGSMGKKTLISDQAADICDKD